jgi:hypothetical protein
MVGKRKKSIRKENYMISRGDGGYLVRKTIRRKVKQVFFGDKKYGGKDKARAAAVDYRDKLLIKMSNEIVFQTNLNNKTTGVVGVSLAANMNRHRNVAVINLRAQAPSAEELKFTSFSAKLHGLWGAYSSAVDFRSRHIFPYTGVSVKSRMIIRSLFKKFRMGFMPLLHRHDGWFGVQSGLRQLMVIQVHIA